MSEFAKRGASGLVVAVAAVELLTTSCTAAPAPEAPPSTTQLDPETERYNQYLKGPKQPCARTIEPTIEAAQACLEVQQETKIAIVNFDFTPAEAQEIAVHVKEPFDQSTRGVYNAQPVVIEATPEAKAEAKERRGSSCVEGFMDFASVAAQATMPEALNADEADIVIALTKASACDPHALGMAEGSRYADIMATPGSYRTMKDLGGAVAHEAGHNIGMGHVSDAFCPTQPSDHMSGPAEFDLTAYLAGCSLNEYGSQAQSVMGNAFHDTLPFKPALPQIPAIMWPQQILEGPQANLAVEATPAGVSLGVEDARADKFISIPVVNTSSAIGSELSMKEGDLEVVIDSIALVPSVDEAEERGAPYDPYIWSSTLQLHTLGNGVVHAGYMESVSPGESGSWKMRIGEQLVTITLAGGRLAVASA